MSSDLLHAALNRATLRDHDARSAGQLSPPMGSSASAASSEGGDHRDPYRGAHTDDDDDDNTYTPVHTRPGTPHRRGREAFASHGGQHGLHSSSTDTESPAGSRSTSPSRLAKKKMAEEAERRKSRDPLLRFDNDISSKIFRELDVPSLARCLRVSKRWRRSATINWAWYLRFQERRNQEDLPSLPIWTRKESKEDWPRRYRSAFTMNGLQYSTAFEMEYEKARSDGYKTPREEREERWAVEATTSSNNTNLGSFGPDKVAAREYYKSLGGRAKVKGKGLGGSSITGPKDKTGYGEEEYY